LLSGMAKAEALQAAQKAVRTSTAHPEWAHPYYWAAFVLSGDPGQVSDNLGPVEQASLDGTEAEEPAADWTLPVVLAGVVLAGGLGFLGLKTLRRKRSPGVTDEKSGRHGPNGV
jgi:CHAT domain